MLSQAGLLLGPCNHSVYRIYTTRRAAGARESQEVMEGGVRRVAPTTSADSSLSVDQGGWVVLTNAAPSAQQQWPQVKLTTLHGTEHPEEPPSAWSVLGGVLHQIQKLGKTVVDTP